MAKSKDVVEKKDNLPATIDFEQHAGEGIEFSRDDVAVPYLTVLQKLSPQCDEDKGEYIEGAKPGMFFDTVTQELMDGREQGILVIPCAFQSVIVEWNRREDGGGFVAVHPKDIDTSDCTRNEKNQLVTPRGTILVDTHYHFVLYRNNDGVWVPAIYSMTSTQLKKSRKWNSLMASIRLNGSNGPYNPPSFSHIYRITTQKESNDAGDWFGVRIEKVEQVSDAATFQEAVAFRKLVMSGAVQTQPPAEDNVVPEAQASGNY